MAVSDAQPISAANLKAVLNRGGGGVLSAKELYHDEKGSPDVTLSEDVKNFKFISVFFSISTRRTGKDPDPLYYLSQDVSMPEGDGCAIFINGYNPAEGWVAAVDGRRVYHSTYSSGTKEHDQLHIHRVIGYR